MSPSKSRSKDKKSGKESSKASSKSILVNAGGGATSSGYNPLLGTFHAIETAPLSSPPLHVNGRYRTIEETDDHGDNFLDTSIEYDSVSNNGSWSGESEDHKEKTSHQPVRHETVSAVDNDKREKIRQKNEKKHQRQKERRAQELHERCSGYLMSRKLELLAQQLVAMGFPQERATMALILNEGRVEESVAWLFEGGEEADKHMEHNVDSGSNLKIDISEELARIAAMEIRYKCSRQEVERVIVACEGDLEKAEGSLRALKEEPPSVPPKLEETAGPPILGNGKLPMHSNQNLMRIQQKAAPAAAIQQQRNDRDLGGTKLAAVAGFPVDRKSKNLQTMEMIQPKMQWAKSQKTGVPVEKRWPVAASSPASFSLSPSLQCSLPPVKSEAHFIGVGSELKIQQLGSVREPVMVMQRHQPINGNVTSATSVRSSSVGTAMSWYPNNVNTLKSNGFIPSVPATRNPNPNSVGTKQLHNKFSYQSTKPSALSTATVDSHGTSRGKAFWGRTSASPTIAAASSLGLFSGLRTNVSSGSSSPLDWSSGDSVAQFDYSNIDWSLDRSSSESEPSGSCAGMKTSMHQETHAVDSYTSKMAMKSSMRSIVSNGSGVSSSGLQEGVGSSEISAIVSRDWSSPFEERDMFSLPRQFVSSTSL